MKSQVPHSLATAHPSGWEAAPPPGDLLLLPPSGNLAAPGPGLVFVPVNCSQHGHHATVLDKAIWRPEDPGEGKVKATVRVRKQGLICACLQ